MNKFIVIGAGPAGAGAAIAASKLGEDVVVYEANNAPGVKPCGRGIPVIGELPIRVPRDSVYHEIHGAIMYVNGEFLFEMKGVLSGYIVDKTLFLESLIIESGAELVKNAKYIPSEGVVKANGTVINIPGSGIFAGGHPYYEGEKILAVQYRIKTSEFDDSDMLEIYFDTEILGYFYVFPAVPGYVDVGVGGFKGFRDLKRLLDTFISKDDRFKDRDRVKLEGARIAVGGIKYGYIRGLVKVGEAAGFVLPLTGEGIRPSLLSGYEAARAIIEGRDPIKAMDSMGISRAIRIQRRILEYVKNLDPDSRAELLKSLPMEVHAEVSLGTLNVGRILSSLASKPRVAAKLLKFIVS
ncbi:MAG: NAD(P)/FAD-dependent oxidoreductase [Desulfurococcales archaeon]|nr:NAD(P)/FAD-dependent oxidoreductase [Desulfurococcales archaeon]